MPFVKIQAVRPVRVRRGRRDEAAGIVISQNVGERERHEMFSAKARSNPPWVRLRCLQGRRRVRTRICRRPARGLAWRVAKSYSLARDIARQVGRRRRHGGSWRRAGPWAADLALMSRPQAPFGTPEVAIAWPRIWRTTQLRVGARDRRLPRSYVALPDAEAAGLATLPGHMPQGTAVRNRSEPATIATPRGPVEAVRQEMRGLRRGTGWTWLWVARRGGKVDWCEGSTPQEAIRRATLLPAGKPPAWLIKAASEAERVLQPAGAEPPDA